MNQKCEDVFQYSKRFGYIHSCPENLGTAMRVSIQVTLPGWYKGGTLQSLKDRCKELKLHLNEKLPESRVFGTLLLQIILINIITNLGSIFSTGNTNIIVPGQKTSLIASELYQVFDTSDVPEGYINILFSKENELNSTLSKHENIDGIWYFGKSLEAQSDIISNSISNLKRYWCPEEKNIDWSNSTNQFLDEFLYQSTQIKNIWIPYGE